MTEQELSDKDLVQRAIGGDRDSFRLLFQRYEGKVFALAHEILRSREDAEDVTQDAFVKAYLSLSDFRGQASFYTWLYRIVFNLSIDLKRKIKRRGGTGVELDERTASDAPTELISRAESPFSAVLRREQSELIKKALDEISEDHRAVIVLREIDGLSYEEIARITGVSRGTVMSRLHYARKKLQKALSDVDPAGGSPSGGALGAEGEGGAQDSSSEGSGEQVTGGLRGLLTRRTKEEMIRLKHLGTSFGAVILVTIILNFFS